MFSAKIDVGHKLLRPSQNNELICPCEKTVWTPILILLEVSYHSLWEGSLMKTDCKVLTSKSFPLFSQYDSVVITAAVIP